MTLTAITIENFKGISAPVTVPLRPITLLFGANSAGKSTIIQAMLYALEVLENRDADVDRTRVGGAAIDLGGFRVLVHGHDLTRKVRLRFHLELDDDGLQAFTRENGGELDPLNDEVCELSEVLKVQDCYVELTMSWNGKAAVVERYGVGLNGQHFATIVGGDDYYGIGNFNEDHPFFDVGEWDFEDEEEWTQGRDGEDVPLNRAFRDIRFPDGTVLCTQVAEGGQIDEVSNEEWFNLDEGMQSVIPDLTRPLMPGKRNAPGAETRDDPNSMFWQHMSQIFVRPGRILLDVLKGIRYLGPLREIPERVAAIQLHVRRERWASGLAAWDLLAQGTEPDDGDRNFLSDFNEYLRNTLKLGYSIRRENRIRLVEDSRLMAELRLFASRYEEYDGDDFREKVLVPLERLESDPALQLRDENQDVDVDPMDIGVGVSQVIPVVVGAMDDKCTIFAVEQPELHIHPAIQARLADVFLREFLSDPEDRSRIALVETHSEHLVLRMLRRIRETSEAERDQEIPAIYPDDVQVVYVKSNAGVTELHPQEISPDGDFVTEWPDGFFEERAKELF